MAFDSWLGVEGMAPNGGLSFFQGMDAVLLFLLTRIAASGARRRTDVIIVSVVALGLSVVNLVLLDRVEQIT